MIILPAVLSVLQFKSVVDVITSCFPVCKFKIEAVFISMFDSCVVICVCKLSVVVVSVVPPSPVEDITLFTIEIL